MIEFRKKLFSKGKSVIKDGINYIKKHPILPISTASLGIGIANYKTNTKRQKEGVEQHKEQLNVLKNLNNNIIKNSEALNNVHSVLKENNIALANKPEKKKSTKRTFLIFRRKNYSIEDGGFKGRKIEPSPGNISSGAIIGGSIGAAGGVFIGTGSGNKKEIGILSAIGAGLGASLGALVTYLSNIADKSIFNKGLSSNVNSYTLLKYLEDYFTEPEQEEENTTTHDLGDGIKFTNTVRRRKKSSNINPRGTLFGVDSDPKKYIINLILRGNVMVLLLNKPTSFELKKLNIILDNYCKSYRLADYTSEKLDKEDIYLVEINIVKGVESSLVINMLESGLKVNILTTDRFGIKNR